MSDSSTNANRRKGERSRNVKILATVGSSIGFVIAIFIITWLFYGQMGVDWLITNIYLPIQPTVMVIAMLSTLIGIYEVNKKFWRGEI